MILVIKLFKEDATEVTSPVPLVFPIIAGLGTMTSFLALLADYELIKIIIAILINIYIIFDIEIL